MRTLCFSLGLLLFHLKSLKFTRSFSQAMQHDFEESTLCCFKFHNLQPPLGRVVNVTKTHASCPIQGFM
uniref:Chemokine interleukin-8-like domain-containing protein n=1 Tax=Oryzias latipes TaxID=8090 RepID=A0A3P9ITQ3_ORYLA